MRSLAKRIILPALLAVGLFGEAAGILSQRPTARAGERFSIATSIHDRQLATWVEKRVQQLQVNAADRRFDEIGWAKDLCEAERLAKKHERPVFLFTHDGRIAIGRC